MTVTVRDDPGRLRYEVREDDVVRGFVTYRLRDGVIDFLHAEVDPAHEGKGLAGQLVSHALDDARSRGLEVLPHCPYVRHYIDGHRDAYLDLVPPDRRAEFGWT